MLIEAFVAVFAFAVVVCAILVLFIFPLIFHELGHYAAWRIFDNDLTFKIGKDYIGVHGYYRRLTRWQRVFVVNAGIYAGLIPIAIGFFVIPYEAMHMLLIYLFYCASDMARLKKELGA